MISQQVPIANKVVIKNSYPPVQQKLLLKMTFYNDIRRLVVSKMVEVKIHKSVSYESTTCNEMKILLLNENPEALELEPTVYDMGTQCLPFL